MNFVRIFSFAKQELTGSYRTDNWLGSSDSDFLLETPKGANDAKSLGIMEGLTPLFRGSCVAEFSIRTHENL